MRPDPLVVERADAIRSRLAMWPMAFERHDQLLAAENGTLALGLLTMT